VKNLPVSDEQHAHALALQEHFDLTSDSLVGLALASFCLFAEQTTGEDHSAAPVRTVHDLAGAWEAVVDGGHHFAELLAPAALGKVRARPELRLARPGTRAPLASRRAPRPGGPSSETLRRRVLDAGPEGGDDDAS